MSIITANPLNNPLIGILFSDLSNQFKEFDGIYSTLAYPMLHERGSVHLRRHSLISNLPTILPHDVFDDHANESRSSSTIQATV